MFYYKNKNLNLNCHPCNSFYMNNKSKSMPRPQTAKNNSKNHGNNEQYLHNFLENENLDSGGVKTFYVKNLK